ncbi:hypothetical protein TNCV_5059701 [Trichonephila clavipes]|nr:hypothetical protein TNCV_5059701 [Trichonephila clavipes]
MAIDTTCKVPDSLKNIHNSPSKDISVSAKFGQKYGFYWNTLRIDVEPGWALSRSRSTGRPPRHFEVTNFTKTEQSFHHTKV